MVRMSDESIIRAFGGRAYSLFLQDVVSLLNCGISVHLTWDTWYEQLSRKDNLALQVSYCEPEHQLFPIPVKLHAAVGNIRIMLTICVLLRHYKH